MKLNFREVAILLGLLICIQGCFNSSSDIVNTQSEADKGVPVYTEAYIEYTGPNQKWAGPQTFVTHVIARGTGNTQMVSFSPALFKVHSLDQKQNGEGSTSKITVETLREEL